ncbi:MAG: hypothetical protein HWE25_07420 [Alphaproteobacteria bacterium]|nr:hypothetical protein [Alphaproteobacteria bacterium]
MFEIFKSEFKRYRLWAGIATVVLLGLYGFIARLKPFLDPDPGQTAMMYLSLISAGAIFGFIQMILHRRANHWTYLIHRPLSPARIYLGIALAGAAVISMVILVPWFCMVGGLDAFTSTVVDARHYTWGFFLLFCVLTSYLVGSLAALNPSKGSVLLAIILLWLMDTQPENDFLQYFPMIVAIAGLVVLNIISFKPDLSTYVRKPWAIAMMVAPMSLALMYGSAMGTTVYYHMPKFIMGTHPDNNPIDGTMSYLWSLEAPEQLAYALEGSNHPRKESYTKQAELADFDYIDAREWVFPRRGQLYTMDLSYALMPAGTGSVWQFSHDEMLLIGYGQIDGKPAGALGQNGFIEKLEDATDADRFTDVPILAGEKFLMTRGTIYQLDFVDRHMDIKHQLPEGEEYIRKPEVKENFVAVVTTKRTLMFDPRVLTEDYGPAEPDYSVNHPTDVSGFSFIDTYRLVDGYLLMYRSNHMRGFDQPGTQVIHAKMGGETELVHARAYDIHRHPSFIRHHFEAISPVIIGVHSTFFSATRPDEQPQMTVTNFMEGKYPANVYRVAIILMVICPIVVFFLSRRHSLGRAQTTTWVILCAVLSLPALAAFVLMNPWRLDKPLT